MIIPRIWFVNISSVFLMCTRFYRKVFIALTVLFLICGMTRVGPYLFPPLAKQDLTQVLFCSVGLGRGVGYESRLELCWTYAGYRLTWCNANQMSLLLDLDSLNI